MTKELLGLPPEITEWICSFVVTKRFSADINEETEIADLTPTRDEQPNITRVNRRLRHESLHLFYRNNRFCLDPTGQDHYSGRGNLLGSQHWIRKLGETNASHLRRLIFRGWMEYDDGYHGWDRCRLT